MFDVKGAFTRQFTPVSGGYVYYPSRKAGGKLVTVEEYERLVADWQRVAGGVGRWKAISVAVAAILLWTFVSEALALAKRADWVMTAVCAAGISGWVLWASMAPRRLVRHRPDIVPPRSLSQARRQARAALNWPFVFFVLLLSGATFLGTASSPDRTLSWWAWVAGSGSFFGAYLWIAVQKLRDQQR